jgi:fatty acid amide hydrolase
MQIHTLTADELRGHLERGELSSVEIVQALFDRSDAIDDRLGGFVHRFRERALREAKEADGERARGHLRGPLHGLPISVKESVDTAGVPSTLGVKARLAHPAIEDAVTVRLAREAGAIVIGKTNVPQTLLSPLETVNHIWGTTHNPWSKKHGSGGSSGGEGAVIATGQSPFGIGTDIGGSIRIPAAFCGIVGLKPTLHRWSNVGSRTAIVGQETVRSQIGPMARSTRDLTLLLRAIDSPKHTPFDPFVPPLPIGDPDSIDVSKLRIGWFDDDAFIRPAASVRRAVQRAKSALEKAGAMLVPFAPPNAAEVVYLMFATLSSDGGSTIDRLLDGEDVIEPLELVRRTARLAPAIRRTIARTSRLLGEDRVAMLLDRLGRKDVEDLWALTGKRTELQLEEAKRWRDAKIDAVICPAMVTPPVPQGMSKDFTLSFAYVVRYNVLNLPAGVVPVGTVRADETTRPKPRDRIDKRAAAVEEQSAGLPLAVQVVGRPWQEHVALAVMSAIESEVRKDPEFPWTPIDPRA